MISDLDKFIEAIKWFAGEGRSAARELQQRAEEDEQLDMAIEEANAWLDDIIASNKIA